MVNWKKGTIMILIGFIVSAIIIGGVYTTAMNIILTDRFPENTTYNGIDISNKTLSEVENSIEELKNSYKIKVQTLGDEIDIKGSDIGIEVKVTEELKFFMGECKGTIWPIKIKLEGREFNGYNVSYDKEALNKILNQSEYISQEKIAVESENAYISKELSSTGEWTIVPEVQGSIIDQDRLDKVMEEKIEKLSDRVNIVEEGVYVEPDITSTNVELNKNLESLNASTSFNISYDINGVKKEFNREYMSEYLEQNEAGEYFVNYEKAADSFVDLLNSELTTLGLGTNFKTTSGKNIYVPGGNWGWWLDWNKTYNKLMELIEVGEDAVGEVYWLQTCPMYGDREFENYVEIDLGNQHLYLYKQGNLIGDWDIVSGMANDPGKRTPEGIYILTYKDTDAVLSGPGYSSPVDYWMPFNGGIGIHDASWQPSFGGDDYFYRGSHGCINMPLDGAATVYNYIDKTYAIICYY